VLLLGIFLYNGRNSQNNEKRGKIPIDILDKTDSPKGENIQRRNMKNKNER